MKKQYNIKNNNVNNSKSMKNEEKVESQRMLNIRQKLIARKLELAGFNVRRRSVNTLMVVFNGSRYFMRFEKNGNFAFYTRCQGVPSAEVYEDSYMWLIGKLNSQLRRTRFLLSYGRVWVLLAVRGVKPQDVVERFKRLVYSSKMAASYFSHHLRSLEVCKRRKREKGMTA